MTIIKVSDRLMVLSLSYHRTGIIDLSSDAQRCLKHISDRHAFLFILFFKSVPSIMLFNPCFDDATIGVAGTDVMKRHRAVRDAFTVLSKFIRPPVCKKNQSWPS